MISVLLLQDSKGYSGFLCEGHAGYAKDDADDVVCAAITAIAATTVTGLTDVLEVDVHYDFQSGRLLCEVLDRKGKIQEVTTLFQVFEVGCKQIEYSYGSEYVQVRDPKDIEED